MSGPSEAASHGVPRPERIRFIGPAEGLRLRLITWPAPHGAGLLVIHHGHGEHAGRWAGVAAALAGLPVTVCAYDLRGHGESSGARGHADGIGELAADFALVAAHAVAEHRPRRTWFLGHSMGGVVVAHAVMAAGGGEGGGARPRLPRPDGVILTSPAFRVPRTRALRLKTMLGRALLGLRPAQTLPSGLDPRDLSRDSGEVGRYRLDPLVHARISLRLGLDFLACGEACIRGAGSFTLPLLACHGTADRVSDIDGTRAFLRGVGSKEVSVLEVDGGFHELHHEVAGARDRHLETLRGWLAARLEGATQA